MMRFDKLVAAVLCLTLVAPIAAPGAAAGQESLVSGAEIERALRNAVADERASRETIRRVLQRTDVIELAESAGIDRLYLDRAAEAASSLEGPELERAAARAEELDQRLAGGATITISLVALLLIIIIVILLAD